MRILYLVNDPGSGPGVLLDEASRAGASADLLHAPAARDLSTGESRDVPESSAGFDALMVLGGTMGVYEAAQHPFIEKTRRLVRVFHSEEKPVMGVCLGAQIVASAFGAPVYRMRDRLATHEEWGFLPQTWLDPAMEDPVLQAAEQGLNIMQWHGDTFDLPEGAVPLATRETCPNQAFRIGPRSYAFQFHLEVTRDILDDWTRLRAAAVGKDRAEIDAIIEPQIASSLDAQERFARRTMRRWMALAR